MATCHRQKTTHNSTRTNSFRNSCNSVVHVLSNIQRTYNVNDKLTTRPLFQHNPSEMLLNSVTNRSLTVTTAYCWCYTNTAALFSGTVTLSIYVHPLNLIPRLEGKWLGWFRWNMAGRTVLGSWSALVNLLHLLRNSASFLLTNPCQPPPSMLSTYRPQHRPVHCTIHNPLTSLLRTNLIITASSHHSMATVSSTPSSRLSKNYKKDASSASETEWHF